MLQRASGNPLTHLGRPPATSGGLWFLVPDLNSGPSEGHLNMRDATSLRSGLSAQERQPRRGLPWPEQIAKGAGSRVAWRPSPEQGRAAICVRAAAPVFWLGV
jgi:hypothetical protein